MTQPAAHLVPLADKRTHGAEDFSVSFWTTTVNSLQGVTTAVTSVMKVDIKIEVTELYHDETLCKRLLTVN